ncbi:MAG: phosphotransferase [Myxococcales bacterium]|nr:phosphotransferase [Myxococcales bacterium]
MDGRLALGGRIAAAAARMGIDRVEEALGRALPRTPEQLARPEVVNALLRAHAPQGAVPLPPVRAARLAGVDFESSNCRNFLVEVEFDEGAARDGALPSTLYAKLPCAERTTRAFANAVGFWETEVAFCARIAHRMPIRVPRVHAAARRGARFALLLENLHALPGARLFLNRDMAAGTTPDVARLCLRAFAKVHAAFEGLPAAEREALLPLRLHAYLSPGGRARTLALGAAAIGPAQRAAPDLVTPAHAALCRRALEKWDALMAVWYAEPLTLIHGDSHLGNCFLHDGPDGTQVGMIDFQGLQWCKGMRDVQYFLADSLEPDVLARHEDELIDDYLRALGERGAALDPALARAQYRACAFQTLMVAVVSLGLGSLTERDETVRTVLRRSLALADRLDLGSWLERL